MLYLLESRLLLNNSLPRVNTLVVVLKLINTALDNRLMAGSLDCVQKFGVPGNPQPEQRFTLPRKDSHFQEGLKITVSLARFLLRSTID